MQKDATITLRLSSDLKAAIEAKAHADHRTTTSLITKILHDWLGDAAISPVENGPATLIERQVPPGRPRLDATRQDALERATAHLPWLRSLIGDAKEVTISELIEKDRQSGGPALPSGIEKAIANALHGLGYTEIVERWSDGTTRRVWTL